MKTFTDGAGRKWDIELDAWAIKQVASRTGVQLGRLLDEGMKLYGELVGDPVKFVDVLFVLVGDQAAKLGVTEEQFFRGLTGDPLEAAYEAFAGAFADFSPSHLRKVLRAATAKAKVAATKKADEAVREIESLDAGATSSNSAAAPPGPPASAPAG